MLVSHSCNREGLRSSDDITLLRELKKTRSVTFGDRAFSICVPKMWNNLPQDIFDLSTTWDRSTMHPKFSPTGVRTHDLQITETPALTTPPSVTSSIHVTKQNRSRKISKLSFLSCRLHDPLTQLP